MNTTTIPPLGDDSNLNVLRPLEFKPDAKTYKGRFVTKTWDAESKDGKLIKRDLVIKVALEEKNELGQPTVVERRYNMLPRARGVSDFKKDMASYLRIKLDDKGNGFPDRYLANQALIQLDGKPVLVAYAKGRGKHASHDRFLPWEDAPATPAAVETPTTVSDTAAPAAAAAILATPPAAPVEAAVPA